VQPQSLPTCLRQRSPVKSLFSFRHVQVATPSGQSNLTRRGRVRGAVREHVSTRRTTVASPDANKQPPVSIRLRARRISDCRLLQQDETRPRSRAGPAYTSSTKFTRSFHTRRAAALDARLAGSTRRVSTWRTRWGPPGVTDNAHGRQTGSEVVRSPRSRFWLCARQINRIGVPSLGLACRGTGSFLMDLARSHGAGLPAKDRDRDGDRGGSTTSTLTP